MMNENEKRTIMGIGIMAVVVSLCVAFLLMLVAIISGL